MSSAFTNPYDPPTGQTWEDLIAEIRAAYYEHRMALRPVWRGSTWIDDIVGGTIDIIGETYSIGDEVRSAGKSWMSLIDSNLDNDPSEETLTTWWEEFDLWAFATTYPSGEEVEYEGQLWTSLKGDNKGNKPGADDEWWQIVTVADWLISSTYATDEKVKYEDHLWKGLQNGNKSHYPGGQGGDKWEYLAGEDSLPFQTIIRDTHARTYWTTMQAWLEAKCVLFLDHVNGPVTLAGDDYLFFTLATLRAAAGLNVNGFRRAREWDGINEPTWLYGIMQAGDIIGPWIFEDLQKMFSALRWTRQAAVPLSLDDYVNPDGWKRWAQAEHLADFNAAWSAAPWVAGINMPYWWDSDVDLWNPGEYGWESQPPGGMKAVIYYAEARQSSDFTWAGYYYAELWKGKRARRQVSLLSSCSLMRIAELWARSFVMGQYTSPPYIPTEFYDIDDLGLSATGPGKISEDDAFPEGNADIDYLVGDIDDSPPTVLGWTSDQDKHYACGGYEPEWILKWSFTYQNA